MRGETRIPSCEQHVELVALLPAPLSDDKPTQRRRHAIGQSRQQYVRISFAHAEGIGETLTDQAVTEMKFKSLSVAWRQAVYIPQLGGGLDAQQVDIWARVVAGRYHGARAVCGGEFPSAGQDLVPRNGVQPWSEFRRVPKLRQPNGCSNECTSHRVDRICLGLRLRAAKAVNRGRVPVVNLANGRSISVQHALDKLAIVNTRNCDAHPGNAPDAPRDVLPESHSVPFRVR
jgi:hypothetical protein